MPARRGRRYPPKKRVSLEWCGFRDGGTPSNLNTSTLFELVPPAGASAVVVTDFTVLRVVGNLSFQSQSGVTSSAAVGAMLFRANVGADQAIDADVPPLTTDVDDFDNNRIMWWQTWSSVAAAAASADFDEVARVVPIDITVKRKMDKRDTLVMRVDAGTTARVRVSVNLRALIRIY